MSAESGTPDIPDAGRMEREAADLVREEQQRSGTSLEGLGYPEVPALDDQPTPEEEAEVAEATVQPFPVVPEEDSEHDVPDQFNATEADIRSGKIPYHDAKKLLAEERARLRTELPEDSSGELPLDKAA